MRKLMVGMVVGAVGERLTWVLAVIVALGATAIAQQQPATDRFAAVAGLVGKWSGTSEGQPGNGTVEREYERVLGSRFIRVRNTSTYPPQAKNPKGERHEDEGFISFDGARKRLVFRQFHVEGFVNTYVQDLEAKTGTVVFVSEGIENIPPGYRARETYIFNGPDEVEEVFELAEPAKEFALYSRTRLRRAK